MSAPSPRHSLKEKSIIRMPKIAADGLTLLVGLMPASRLKNWALNRLGWHVGPGAHVGPGLYLRIGAVHLGVDSRIGPFNVIRGLAALRLGDYSRIGQWNWISASGELVAAGGRGTLTIGAHSAITSRHYFDCSGGVAVGSFSTLAGVRSTFITHGIDWRTAEQRTKEIRIGDYCLISSNCAVPPGVTIPDRTVVGMGTVVGDPGRESGTLQLGGRGAPVKSDLTGVYFDRARGYISAIQRKPE